MQNKGKKIKGKRDVKKTRSETTGQKILKYIYVSGTMYIYTRKNETIKFTSISHVSIERIFIMNSL